jgi:hypothetical protein
METNPLSETCFWEKSQAMGNAENNSHIPNYLVDCVIWQGYQAG